MPTYSSDIISLVKIKNGEEGTSGKSINWRGDYDSKTLYNPLDAVRYEGNAYVCIEAATGAIPWIDEEIWELMVEKGADGKDGLTYKLITNQEKILKFYEQSNSTKDLKFSPQDFIFNVIKQTDSTDTNLFYSTDSASSSKNDFSLKIEADGGDAQWFTLFDDYYGNSSSLSIFNALSDNLAFTTINGKTVITIKIQELAESTIIEPATTDAQKNFNNFINLLKTSSLSLLISVRSKDGKQLILSVPFTIDFGMRDEMAQFQLNASGINAAIQNTSLTFNANGLTVRNGDFKILDKNGEGVLTSDTDGNLFLKGQIEATSGVFNGTVYATDGTFNGTINAKDGYLQDVSITGVMNVGDIVLDGREYLDDEHTEVNPRLGIYSNSYYTSSTNNTETGEGFRIKTDGSIIGNRITLGEYASIKKFLKVGDSCWINNPLSSTDFGDNFIYIEKSVVEEDSTVKTVPSFRVTKDGRLFLGEDETGVIIDGVSGTIHSGNYFQSSQGWSINPKSAEFNNVTVRGSIKASVLEYGEVQAIGGILVVRPSSIIKSYTQSGSSCQVTLENATWIKVGDYCQIGYGNSDVSEITIQVTQISGNSVSFTLSQTLDDSIIGQPFISYLNVTNDLTTDNIGIGINSTLNDSFTVPQALSIFQSELEDGVIKRTPVVILGQMPNTTEVPEAIQGGYGLYADNAYLKGSLIAEGVSNNTSYSAGINTKSSIPMPNDNGEFSANAVMGNIILWAGAEGTSSDAISKARFRVDTQGNLYANSGYFNGTIITNSTISASEITTAVLKGKGDTKEDGSVAALTIQDAYTGIDFKVGNGTKMKLTAEGLQLNVPLTLTQELNLDGMRLSSPIIVVNDPEGNYGVRSSKATAIIEPNAFSFYEGGVPTNDRNIDYSGSLYYNNGLKVSILKKELASFNTDLSADFNGDLKANQNFILGGKNRYQQVYDSATGSSLVGYDLYIEE